MALKFKGKHSKTVRDYARGAGTVQNVNENTHLIHELLTDLILVSLVCHVKSKLVKLLLTAFSFD